ncbi:hypothetical protein CCHR01_11586 [Colletotrichum chrysophilum]|uniref:Uncharacterized protein n=1 Tax=Colletotrichum chrysophilum TaxID=1836956 RepID=A0AAD9AF23_9PEZI|nr:hypothetical protein CCHR01_11586 [Colletotrichum chrysophilum]
MHSWQLVHWFFLDCGTGTGTGARAANIWTGLCRRRPRGEGDAVNLPPGRRLSIHGARAVTRFIPFSAACPALCGGHGVSVRSYSPHCFLLEARSGVLWHCTFLEFFGLYPGDRHEGSLDGCVRAVEGIRQFGGQRFGFGA